MRKRMDFLSMHCLRRIDIRYRLINSFILVSLLPLLVSGIIAYQQTSKATQDKIRIYSVQVVKQISQNLLLRMEQIESIGEELILSDALQNRLANYYGHNEAAAASARAGVSRLLLDSFGASAYVNQQYILDRQRKVIDTQASPQMTGNVEQLAKNAPVLNGKTWWTLYNAGRQQQSLAMLREIRFTGNNRSAGFLFVGVRPSHFFQIFDGVDLGYASSLFIVDKDGDIVVQGGAADDVNENGSMADPALMRGIADSRVQQRNSDFISYTGRDGKPYYAAIAHIPHTSWMVVSATPGDRINADSRSVRNKMIVIGLLCFLVSLLLSYLISRSISLPLQQLVSVMKETEGGNSRIRMRQGGGDEIAVLSVRFNEMASKIHLNKEQLEEQVALRTRELENANRKLAALSATDGLTGVANRRRFDEALAGELRRSARAGKPLSLLMLDVDHFKKYNDRYGHQAGDECLRIVARILQNISRRATDLVARYGGEEFAVILAEGEAASALQQAENICAAICEARIAHADSPFAYVTASIGLATMRANESMTPEELLRIADEALYQAKNQGRHRAVLAPDKRKSRLKGVA